jgi:solute carrier family 25 folate transporter 32
MDLNFFFQIYDEPGSLYSIARSEGIRGLYRGIGPAMLGVSHGGIQFMVYEELKSYHSTYKSKHGCSWFPVRF